MAQPVVERGVGGLNQHAVGERLGQLDIDRIVLQRERLQRRARLRTLHGASRSVRSVKIHKTWIGSAAPPDRINAAAVGIPSGARPVGIIDRAGDSPNAIWLWRKN